MGYIFISHSSKDNDKAKETANWLSKQGFTSLFLDFDPELGIPAGCNWEQELYYKLRKCRAVIFLCSEHSAASDWCFAEIALARALGKSIFPVKIKPCQVKPPLTDIQAIDLTINPKEGYERLWKGLAKSGLDPKDFFQPDPKRTPYPGLLAFQEKDAAVFFGRDDSIRDTLDTLNNLRRYGGRHIVILLGASGSGKSSLVRAGLVPRLKRDPDAWIVINPFRPRQHPLDELAIVLSETFDRYGQSRNREDISEHLRNAAGSTPLDASALSQLIRELSISANKRDAAILLVIDQFEELLSLATDSEATRFLFLLREVLSKEDNELIVLGTLRSDFLHEFQNHTALYDIPFEEVMVGPLTVDGYAKVIEGPAEVAGLKLEPGLTELMIKDTETEDALPLLAFTLRELWELYGHQDGDLTTEEYRDKLGGLLGSVQRAADGVINAHSLSEQQKRDLHRAFLSMTQINEKGQYARRTAHWNDLPPTSQEILHRFVEARLIVSGKEDGTLEVAHEALLRNWPLLKGWLDEDREFLLWRQRLHAGLSEFKHSGLLLRDASLTEAERWKESHSADLDTTEREFIDCSIQQRQAEQNAQRKRRRNIYIGLATGLVIALILAGLAGWQWYQAEQQRQFALARQLAAQSELMRNEKVELTEQSVLLAVEAAKRSPAPILEVGKAIHHGLMLLPHPFKRLEHAGSSPLVHAFSPDGKYLATGNADGTLQIWELPTGREFAIFKHADPVRFVVFSRNGANIISVTSRNVVSDWELLTKRNVTRLQFDGSFFGFIDDAKYIAIISPDERVLRVLALSSGQEINHIVPDYPIHPLGYAERLRINDKYLAIVDANAALVWEVKSGQKIARLEHASKGTSDQEVYIDDIEFSPDNRLLVTAGKYNTARLWEIDTGQEVGNLPHEDRVEKVVFSPDGQYLATATSNRNIQVWNLNDRRVVARLTLDKPLHSALAMHSVVLVFSRDSTHLAIADLVDNVSMARVLSLVEGREVARTLLAKSPRTIALSPDSRYLATRGPNDKTLLLEIDNGSQIARMNVFYGVSEIAFSPDQKYLATASPYKFASVWNLLDGSEVYSFTHNSRVESAAFSHDGKYLATGIIGGEAKLWEIASQQEFKAVKHAGGVWSVAFSPNGKYLATAGGENDKTAVVWATDTYDEVTRFPHAGAVQKVAFDSDGKYLATASADGSAVVWEMPSGKEMVRLKHDQKVNAVMFSHDGDYLATASEDGTARIWKLMDGREMHVFRHDGPVHSVAFSPDTKYLATAADKSIMIWDIVHEQVWFRVTEESGARAVAFSPDGKFLAAGSGAGVTVWLWQPADLISEACQRLTRNLSGKEWEEYLGGESCQPTCPGLPIMCKD